MRILLDTNVIVRLSEANQPSAHDSRRAVALLPEQGHECCLVPQVIYEYWSVVTRPLENNGLGLTPDEAERDLADYLDLFTLLRDERAVYERWRNLVRSHQVIGKNAHDARLVAAMQRHSLDHILTFNVTDFARYPGLTVWSPADVLEAAR